MRKPFSHQRYNYFYQCFLPLRCLWYDFIIRLCHLLLPPQFLFCPKLHAANPTSGISLRNLLWKEEKKKSVLSESSTLFFKEVTIFDLSWRIRRDASVLLAVIKYKAELCDVCPSFFRIFFWFLLSVCLSGRDELSKPSCCHDMRVSSWSWSALAWVSSGQFTSVWRGWMAACTP